MISDLLKPERQNLVIREDRKRGVFVEGLSEWVVRSPAEVYGLMERGAAQRATGATKLNEMSSRSHAVFIIIVEKSTVMAEDTLAAEDEEMEQFRGLAPGNTILSACLTSITPVGFASCFILVSSQTCALRNQDVPTWRISTSTL